MALTLQQYVKGISSTGMQSKYGFDGQVNACWTHKMSKKELETIRPAGFPVSVIHGRYLTWKSWVKLNYILHRVYFTECSIHRMLTMSQTYFTQPDVTILVTTLGVGYNRPPSAEISLFVWMTSLIWLIITWFGADMTLLLSWVMQSDLQRNYIHVQEWLNLAVDI